ncbi:MAG: hypothetical protein JJ832_009715, partial [Prochlorococcus marinus XMU1423]|nr:hypothetical protein [Prochlorococcus marinus XMU1423]
DLSESTFVDGQGGYVFSPPDPSPSGLLSPDQQAAAAGLSVADWANTAEGRAHSQAVEEEALAQMTLAGEGQGIYGFEPPEGPSAQDLAERDEFEAAAAAAGLALEDYSDTPEGRARAEEMGRRAEERDIAAGLILPSPGNNLGQQASQSEIDGWQRGEDGSLMPPANWAV